jgi:membrane fusion protein, copper/silver efflux system
VSRRWLVLAGVLALAAAIATVTLTPVGGRALGFLAGEDPVSLASTSPPSSAAPNEAMGQSPARGEVTVDTRRQQLIGVRTEAVRRESIAPEIRAVGIVGYDETRQTEINTKISGWIRDLYADYTGKPVRAGEPLFTLYSPELLTTQNEYLLAHRGHGQSGQSGLEDVRLYSERLLAAARQRLLLWDLSADDIEELEQKGQATGVMTFRSPSSGVLVEKAAVKGMRVMAGQMLFRVADLSTVWIEADVYERDLAQVRVGRPTAVVLDAYPGETFTGRVAYIYPSLNETTRTARVRVQLANRGGRLKPGMYANVQLEGQAGTALTVPANAVLDSGTQQIVFVSHGEGMFTPRTVTVGRRFGERTEILEGLTEGEQVAMGATFFLDSESQLRAGLQNYQEPAAPRAPAGVGPALVIAFRSTTEPPRTGENVFEVTVKDPTGQPVTDAEVAVQLFMPAMPTMNMPAMRNETKLTHVSGGRYQGPGQVMMGGRWDVTVTVSRNGRRAGSEQFALVAR